MRLVFADIIFKSATKWILIKARVKRNHFEKIVKQEKLIVNNTYCDAFGFYFHVLKIVCNKWNHNFWSHVLLGVKWCAFFSSFLYKIANFQSHIFITHKTKFRAKRDTKKHDKLCVKRVGAAVFIYQLALIQIKWPVNVWCCLTGCQSRLASWLTDEKKTNIEWRELKMKNITLKDPLNFRASHKNDYSYTKDVNVGCKYEKTPRSLHHSNSKTEICDVEWKICGD